MSMCPTQLSPQGWGGSEQPLQLDMLARQMGQASWARQTRSHSRALLKPEKALQAPAEPRLHPLEACSEEALPTESDHC